MVPAQEKVLNAIEIGCIQGEGVSLCHHSPIPCARAWLPLACVVRWCGDKNTREEEGKMEVRKEG